MNDSFSCIPNAFAVRYALPRPDWEVIAAWVDAHVSIDLQDATWTQIARDWMMRLAHSLEPGYAVHESPNFLLLADHSIETEHVLDHAERARSAILHLLGEVASDKGFGKQVILMFAAADFYYDYIADFYPEEGEFALSSGVFLDRGYGHFATGPTAGDDCDRVIAHEMTHALVRHLPLPLWLNEGLAQFIEDTVVEWSSFSIDREIRRRHQEYWNEPTIHSFWSGASFHSPDDGQELSYHLSQVLFRNLLSDYPLRVKSIINHASYSDGGNRAFVDFCHESLQERAEQFLGKGPWAPRDAYAF